jgi:cell fate (sporulation/competence/biofilm development) regulator YlbF (YheA/YmcA/DUF963 family)
MLSKILDQKKGLDELITQTKEYVDGKETGKTVEKNKTVSKKYEKDLRSR